MLEWTRQSFLWWRPSWPSLEDRVRKKEHYLDSPPQAFKISYASLPVVLYICVSKVYQKYRILWGSFIFLSNFWTYLYFIINILNIYFILFVQYPSVFYAEKKDEQISKDIWKKRKHHAYGTYSFYSSTLSYLPSPLPVSSPPK